MGKFDILDSGVPYSMDKTKNYVKLEDGSVEEIVDLSDLETTEVGFIGHKANIHKAELTDRNISVLDEKILTLKNNVYTKSEIATQISTAVNDLIDGAPGALDTLNELAAALSDDASFATTITNSIASHTGNTSNPHSVTKTQVGLSNVDNTADTNKPVSTAQAAAIALKQDASTAVTLTGAETLTNKYIGDTGSFIAANQVHFKIRASETLSQGNTLMIVGYDTATDSYDMAKWTVASGKPAIALCKDNIAQGEYGRAAHAGLLRYWNTSAYNVGDILYPANNGGLTTTKPTSGTYQACVFILASHATSGASLVAFTEPLPVNWDSRYYTETEIDTAYGNVNNTSDVNKPVSTAQEARIQQAEANALAFAIALG